MILSDKKQVQQLASLLRANEIQDIVISPGSRNGPLIHTFAGSGCFSCRNIVDERSAAYFALGMAQAQNKPVALLCSSGTATLNYAPAVAEAFQAGIPLLVLTADRPGYWINQLENQSIRQSGIYANFVKKEINLPLGETPNELWHAAQQINECLNTARSEKPGPVHINIPLEEPLHRIVNGDFPPVKVIDRSPIYSELVDSEINKLAAIVDKATKIMIVAGQHDDDSALESALSAWVQKAGAVVLKEHLSNLNSEYFCSNIDAILAANAEPEEEYYPDLVISFGGQMVSKSLKQFLRKHKPAEHWHLSLSADHFDTYQALTKVIPCSTQSFFKKILSGISQKSNSYHRLWSARENEVVALRSRFLSQTPWCDLSVFEQLQRAIPAHSIVHLGNSSPVRYALIFDAAKQVRYYGNRGTSGIDGSLSTAAGFASVSEKLNTVILGDLSFFYDSNALWNNYIGKNLRIIVINNGGGNIFSLIQGPNNSPAFQQHFFAENKAKAEGLAQTFGLDYLKAENSDELQRSLKSFYSAERQCPALLEIFTNAEVNASAFQQFFKFVKQ